MESALMKVGGVKKCSQGYDGRGMDSRNPSYMAIYEVPGNRTEAANRVVSAGKAAGFDLAKIPSPSGAPNDVFYEDRTKDAKFDAVSDGNSQLITTIFATKGYASLSGSCTLVDRGVDAPKNTTTVDLTVNLPALK